jgi:hypothetical protein
MKQLSIKTLTSLRSLKTLQLSILIVMAGILAACQTDGEYAELMNRITPIRAEFKYIADPEARFAVEYAGVELGVFTLSGSQSRNTVYVNENRMNNLLRVYRLENDERKLDMEEQVGVLPVVVGGSGNYGDNVYSAISLVQLSAGSPVQVLPTPETPADSSSIALQFFYSDALQPEEVKITILAVDQYSLITTKPKTYVLDSVPDTMKAEVEEINLRRGEISETMVLNLYQFKNPTAQLAARFFYRVSDSAGNVLQDYKVGSTSTNSAEIKPASALKNKIPYPTYKSAIMRWTYKSATEPFASPVVLQDGEKW